MTKSTPAGTADDRSEVVVIPLPSMAFAPPIRKGPPPRSFAADAHDCIMVRTLMEGSAEYKVVATIFRRPVLASSPSDRLTKREITMQ